MPIVNSCVSFLDRSAENDDRSISWNFSIAQDAERCLQISSGQSVVWTGNFEFHPLTGGGGTTPSPIELKDSDSEDYVVLFPSPGVYGYNCESHNEMRGAVLVLP
jgi:plastocyanin